jgi:hypothetical protein
MGGENNSFKIVIFVKFCLQFTVYSLRFIVSFSVLQDGYNVDTRIIACNLKLAAVAGN